MNIHIAHRPQMEEIQSIVYNFNKTKFGQILIARTDIGICNIFLGDSSDELIRELQKRWDNRGILHESKEDRILDIDQYLIDGTILDKTSIHLFGTQFQLKVWRALLSIPFGKTTSYQSISQYIEKPKAYRAVATAIGKNPISLLIPCHRVIRADGDIGGYHWGKNKKQQILEWEKHLAKRT